MSLSVLKNLVKEKSDKEQGKFLQKFFKTGKGEYAEGDVFAGIKVPVSRSIAKNHLNLTFSDLQKLLNSKIHEKRLIALLIYLFSLKSTEKVMKKIKSKYLIFM